MSDYDFEPTVARDSNGTVVIKMTTLQVLYLLDVLATADEEATGELESLAEAFACVGLEKVDPINEEDSE